jgi:hypothetical protein
MAANDINRAMWSLEEYSLKALQLMSGTQALVRSADKGDPDDFVTIGTELLADPTAGSNEGGPQTTFRRLER